MHVDTSRIVWGGKRHERHLLRESYREGGRVRHRTPANLSPCSEEEVAVRSGPRVGAASGAAPQGFRFITAIGKPQSARC